MEVNNRYSTNVFIILQNIVYKYKLWKNDVVIVNYIFSLYVTMCERNNIMSKTRPPYT